MTTESARQRMVDIFYKTHGPCCAGCDWWRWHNSLIGDCTKNAPVSGRERWSMVGLEYASLQPQSGHLVTRRDHVCGDFVDTYDWEAKQQ